jgi:hypothetical protein
MAAHQQDPGMRTQAGEFSSQIAATDPGHDHICEQQIDGPQAGAASFQCFGRVSGNYQPVAGGFEDFGSRLPDERLILHQQNGFWPAPLADWG